MNRLPQSLILLLSVLFIATLADDAFARGRIHHPRLGRFMQRDPLGTRIAPQLAVHSNLTRNVSARRFTQRDPAPGLQYADGMNLYAAYHVMHGGVDPSGLLRIRVGYRGLGPAILAGNDWHDRLIGSVVSSDLYDWTGGTESINSILSQIDANGDELITEDEVEDLDLGLHGYSQGAVGAIDVSKRLSVENQDVGKYRLCVPVPVKILVTIDPASFAFVIPSPKDNVEKTVNYYQRRGGKSLWYRLDVNGNPVGDPNEFGNWFSAMVKGNSVSSANNKRIDTRSGYRNGIFGFYTRMYAKDVNHDTIPWYVAPEAVADLR